MDNNSLKKLDNSVFFAWTRISRRSEELSQYFGCEYVRFNRWGNNKFTISCSLVINFFRTVLWIIYNRPLIVFTFNAHPFITISAKLGTWIVRKGQVIPDLHTAAYTDHFSGISGSVAKWIWKKCPIILIHNSESKSYLSEQLPELNESLYVLEDVIPEFDLRGNDSHVESKPRCVLISRFADDEPIEYFLKAASQVDHYDYFITGNFQKASFDLSSYQKDNITFTGFLSDIDYFFLLKSAEIIAVLTTRDMTLLSGGYEALAFEKPIIISNTKTLNDYFKDSVLYTDNSSDALYLSIASSINKIPVLKEKIKLLKKEKQGEWTEKAYNLVSKLTV